MTRTLIGLSLLVACADDPVESSETTSAPNDSVVISPDIDKDVASSCTFVEWTSADAPKRQHSCTASASGHVCDCAGVSATSALADCDAAIADACGVDTSRSYCERYGHTCWPGADVDDWMCRCEMDAVASPIEAADCGRALFAGCTTACSSEAGVCAPVEGSDWQFGCECDFYPGGARTFASAYDCHDALRDCVPRRGACGNFAGFCDPEDGGFACRCRDGTTAAPRFADLGHDDCADAVAAVCGNPDAPADFACEATFTIAGISAYHASCMALELGDESPREFSCACSFEGVRRQKFSASTCDLALDAICP